MRRLVRMTFILGPVVLTIGLVLASKLLQPGSSLTGAILYGLFTLIVWHCALLYTHRDSVGHLVYAVFNIFVYFHLLARVPGVIDL